MCLLCVCVCVSSALGQVYSNKAAHSQPVGEQEVNSSHWLQSHYRLHFNDGRRWRSQVDGGWWRKKGHGEAMGERERETKGVCEAKSQTQRDRKTVHLRTQRGRSSLQQLPQPPTHSHPLAYFAYCINIIKILFWEEIHIFLAEGGERAIHTSSGFFLAFGGWLCTIVSIIGLPTVRAGWYTYRWNIYHFHFLLD